MSVSGPGKCPARILIVEDEIIFAESLAKSLEHLGFQIAGIASTAEEAIRAAFDSMPNLILMDINLGGQLDGIEAYDSIRIQFDIPVVYLTAHAERDVLDRAKLTEPYGYLTKPITFPELRSTIETVLHKHEADRRVRRSEARLAKAEETSPPRQLGMGYLYRNPGVVGRIVSCLRTRSSSNRALLGSVRQRGASSGQRIGRHRN